jgi:hypothetical protein
VSDIDITAWYAHWLFSWTLNAFSDIKGYRGGPKTLGAFLRAPPSYI